MSPTLIVRLAVLALAAMAPIVSFAQTLSPSVATPTAFSLDRAVPQYRVVESSPAPRIPLAAKPVFGSDAAIVASMEDVVDRAIYKTPRKRIADFALSLRDIRYRRAGRDPSTGFDCSGFTHYVYNKTFGVELPYDAPSQYRDGEKIAREEMKVGDLVFFQVRGHITHVGMYMGEGRFIHSPAPGKRVRVDELANAYWAKRWAGARRVHLS
ncbi:MAG: C40 family peptidase [Proteobacteria bacterium]|nr:C40 family peptidase [Pseudomonadota bacterium]